jgi:hypothetical protein
MDFSLFFHGPEAIHQGPPTVPSHGCIHVLPLEAERLFNWVHAPAGFFPPQTVDVLVFVLKKTR